MAAAIQKTRVVHDPQIVKTLLANPRAAWVWLVVRVWLGVQWIEASLSKLDNPAWIQTGAALKAFWSTAVQVPPDARPLIAFDWYRSFIQYLLDVQAYTWFGKLIAYGELLVGAALILGAFTGLAAFFGGLMNWNYMLAGSTSTNPLLFVAAIGLIMAWKIAGYLGLDYFLLPIIGTPWGRGNQNKKT